MKYRNPVFIAAAKRSPIGRFGGGLKSLSPADLLLPVAEAVTPLQLKPFVDQVLVGQVLQAGSGMNIARQLGLRLGLAQSSPAFTVNMACASGLKAVVLAADSIDAGDSSLVLAGGVESMSRAPHYAMDLRWGKKLGDSALQDSIHVDGLVDPVIKTGMGETAERIAGQLEISRQDQDQFALESQCRTAASKDAMRREKVIVRTKLGGIAEDEQMRPDTTLEGLSLLKPVFRADGSVTAGNSSSLNDGSALVLVVSGAAVEKHKLMPLARVIAATAVGCDPSLMGLGPVGAIRKLCVETGWPIDSVDAVEINEAFAVQTLGCARVLGVDLLKLNRRGGAIALGHPVGCSGARVLVTLVHIMEDLNLRRGMVALCVGGGMGIAMAVERS